MLTKRLRRRNMTGLSSNRSGRNPGVSDAANQGSDKKRSDPYTHSGVSAWRSQARMPHLKDVFVVDPLAHMIEVNCPRTSNTTQNLVRFCRLPH